MSSRKRKRALIALAERLGVDGAAVAMTRRSNHYVIRLPNGSRVYASGTPSDRRADHQIRAAIRRSMKSKDVTYG
jgi:hypothetical protein